MRRIPYTATGLSRCKCVRCDRPAAHQWSLRPCAIGRTGWYALCDEHDLEFNRFTMDFLKLPDAAERLKVYQKGTRHD